MHWAARRNGEGLGAASIDFCTRLRSSEAEREEIAEEWNTCRGAAASIPALREDRAAEREAVARGGEELRVRVNHLRADSSRAERCTEAGRTDRLRHAGRRLAPSAAGRRPGHEGYGRSCKPTMTENHRPQEAATGRQACSRAGATSWAGGGEGQKEPRERRPCSRAGATRATGILSTTSGGSS